MGWCARDRRAVLEAWSIAHVVTDRDEVAERLRRRWCSVPARPVAGVGQLEPDEGVAVHLTPATRHSDSAVTTVVDVCRALMTPWMLSSDLGQGGRLTLRVHDDALAEVTSALRAGTRWRATWSPAFTCEVAPGMAWYEAEPGDEFGRRRTDLVADVVMAVPRGWQAPAVLDAVAERFRLVGIDPSAPYLRPSPVCIG